MITATCQRCEIFNRYVYIVVQHSVFRIFRTVEFITRLKSLLPRSRLICVSSQPRLELSPPRNTRRTLRTPNATVIQSRTFPPTHSCALFRIRRLKSTCRNTRTRTRRIVRWSSLCDRRDRRTLRTCAKDTTTVPLDSAR